MDAKLESRRVQADQLRAMWSTHTRQSEPVRVEFFSAVDRAVEAGFMEPVSVIGDMLCVSLSTGSIFVLFPSPSLKAEFLAALQSLLSDDPAAQILSERF